MLCSSIYLRWPFCAFPRLAFLCRSLTHNSRPTVSYLISVYATPVLCLACPAAVLFQERDGGGPDPVHIQGSEISSAVGRTARRRVVVVQQSLRGRGVSDGRGDGRRGFRAPPGVALAPGASIVATRRVVGCLLSFLRFSGVSVSHLISSHVRMGARQQ